MHYTAPRRPSLAVIAAVALLHVAAIFGLIRAFAPGISAQIGDTVLAAFAIATPTPTPPPPPPPPARTPEKSGAAAPAGRKAVPRPVAAPKVRIVLARQSAPPVAGKGAANSAGAAAQGEGTGAGGQGQGTGSGNGGDGTGGGGAVTKAVKIAGEINSARDYPRETRDLRIGGAVIIALTVGTDGKVTACRVRRASKDAQADQITCRLATERFRFRPATDAAGNPVVSVFGWQQRWFYPAEKN